MFQKHASGLNAREAALTAVLLRAPSASRKALARRACGVLEQMGKPGECRGLGDFVYLSLLRKSARRADSDGIAPQFARRVQIGRAACRERVCQYVSISVVAVNIKKKNTDHKQS